MIGLQLIGHYVYLNLPLRGSGHRDRTHTGNAVERIGHLLVEDLIQCPGTLFCRGGEDDHRDHVGAELQDQRIFGAIRQEARYHAHLVAYVVHHGIHVGPEVELQHDHRHSVARLGGDLLQLFGGIEHIFQGTGHVGFHILGSCTCIRCHHRHNIQVDVRIEIDGKLSVKQDSDQNHPDKYQ